MKVLVPVKRVIDYNVKARVKPDGSGVDLDHFAPSPLPGAASFLVVARLLQAKGIGEYIDAARRVLRGQSSVEEELTQLRDELSRS